MKLGSNIHHVSGHCWNSFQSQKSKVKVTARCNALFRYRNTQDLQLSIRCPSGGGIQTDSVASRTTCHDISSITTNSNL